MTESKREVTEQGATEARILQAAEELFARRGLSGTRVREIADAADLNAATLYIYFQNKTALYQAVLDRGFAPIARLVAEFGPDEPPEALEKLLGEVLRYLARRPHLSRLIYLEAISEGPFLSHLARTWFRPLCERMIGLLKGGKRRGTWDDDQLPLVVAAIVHVVFGHFGIAPLLEETFDRDPLSAESIRRQTSFLMLLLKRMFPALEDPREIHI